MKLLFKLNDRFSAQSSKVDEKLYLQYSQVIEKPKFIALEKTLRT